jgi:hypothetical protein
LDAWNKQIEFVFHWGEAFSFLFSFLSFLFFFFKGEGLSNWGSYRDYLLSDVWKKKRLEAIERAGGKCQLCNRNHCLHVHHRKYSTWGEEPITDLTVLCEDCHNKFSQQYDYIGNTHCPKQKKTKRQLRLERREQKAKKKQMEAAHHYIPPLAERPTLELTQEQIKRLRLKMLCIKTIDHKLSANQKSMKMAAERHENILPYLEIHQDLMTRKRFVLNHDGEQEVKLKTDVFVMGDDPTQNLRGMIRSTKLALGSVIDSAKMNYVDNDKRLTIETSNDFQRGTVKRNRGLIYEAARRCFCNEVKLDIL